MKVHIFVIVMVLDFFACYIALGTEHHFNFKSDRDSNNIDIPVTHNKCNIYAALGHSDVFIVFSSLVDNMGIIFYIADVYSGSDGTTSSYNLFQETQLIEKFNSDKNFYYNTYWRN